MKKIISIITVAVLLMAMTVTAFAFPDPTGDKSAWLEAENFTPVTFKAAKATGTINVDGAVAVDSAYGSGNTIAVQGFSEYGGLAETNGATGNAKVAWDSDYIYIHFNVKDETKGIGGGFESDSIEVYLDYDQKADGKKVKWNKVSSSDTHSAQYRVQRGGNTVDNAVVGNETMISVGERASVKVVENGTAGYVVEMKFPLKDKSGKYIPVSNTIGFELQINDSKDGGNTRHSAAYIQGGTQYYAYEYSSLFDNIKLDGATDITWSTRTVRTEINETLRDFDPNSKYVPKVSSTASKTSSTASKTSSTASKVSSAASTASTASTVESTVSATESVADKDTPAGTEEPKGDDADTDTENSDTANTIGAEEDGGLSTPILIAIIAGGVLVLAAAGVAVFFIIKKKKAK